jgi:hypothetical protein
MDDRWEKLIRPAEAGTEAEPVSTRLKSRVYSALMLEMEKEGPLLGLDQTGAAGRGVCVFEKLVQIAPVGTQAQEFNYCRICHGRLMGEHIENPPLYWPCCPYADFKKC